jgi:crossover junction endodeoxyribonuclease RuvC
MSAARVAVGYDPGTAQSGFGVIARVGSRLELRDAGTIKTEPHFTLIERLEFIHHQLTAVVVEHRPLVMGIENQLGIAAAARGRLNGQIAQLRRGEQPKFIGYNSDNDGVMGAQFVAMSVAFAYRVRVVLLEPKTIKVMVAGQGSGDADKHAIKTAVQRVFPELQEARFSSHAADGIATAIGAERYDHNEGLARRSG